MKRNNKIQKKIILILCFLMNSLCLFAQNNKLKKNDNIRIKKILTHLSFIQEIQNKSIFNFISTQQIDRKKRIFSLEFESKINEKRNSFKHRMQYDTNSKLMVEINFSNDVINSQFCDSVRINKDELHKLNNILEINKLVDVYVAKDDFGTRIRVVYKERFINYYYYEFFLLNTKIMNEQENEIKKRFKDMIWLDTHLVVNKGKGVFLD